jgi:acetylornithine/N-succinyldiaminopimelate aminotransferase
MLATSDVMRRRQGFGPLPEGFFHVPFNDLSALESVLDDRTAALILEPIQGEGGVIAATQSYLAGARALCRERGVVLILDEVQTGVGRLGTLWAHQRYGITPDVVTWSKGIGGGLPLAVMG